MSFPRRRAPGLGLLGNSPVCRKVLALASIIGNNERKVS